MCVGHGYGLDTENGITLHQPAQDLIQKVLVVGDSLRCESNIAMAAFQRCNVLLHTLRGKLEPLDVTTKSGPAVRSKDCRQVSGLHEQLGDEA